MKKNVRSDEMFINNVIAYYKKQARNTLPWRKNVTPYSVLVSETMLQQTQVSRVAPKYLLWMKYFKTLSSLRKSSFKDVLLLWQGLGYQRRAKALYAIAQEVTRIPTTLPELCELPGVGTYTASAVCAFAYDRFDHPLLETNIRTAVIEHFYEAREGVDDKDIYAKLRTLEGYQRVRALGARVWYYALMDYGAHLKANKISHNTKSKHYTKQSPFAGSTRELRAKILFAITHGSSLPKDVRRKKVLETLVREGYIQRRGTSFEIM
jgi:A/G-specific adenine glycosylase